MELNSDNTELTINASYPLISFDMESNISIQTSSNWAKGIDFDYILTEISTSEYKIIFTYFKLEYDQVLTVTLSKAQSLTPLNETFIYPDQSYSKHVLLYVPESFGFNENQAKTISKTSGYVSEFGQFFVVLVPGLASFIGLLNILKLVALYPVQFNLKFVKFLRLFVKFNEEDILAKLFMSNKLYTEKYIELKRYIPKNRYFQFVSIYPRIRGFKILLRILINILFFIFARKLAKTLESNESFLIHRREVSQASLTPLTQKSSSKVLSRYSKNVDKKRVKKKPTRLQKKLKRIQFILRVMLEIMRSLDYVNIVSNTLLIYTSLHRGVSVFDCCVIVVDLISIAIFQSIIIIIYLKYKNQRTQDIKNLVHQELIFIVFPFQNGSRIMMPLTTWMNVFELIRLFLFSLFKTSHILLGITSGLFNIWVIIFITLKCI